ncbi:hypothetical protein [Raineyella sp. W15-4]|uniref:hypothetical protein n=1 Tax=Raineyella sp. W15-4 TaxID=3081651 RepID=UPI002952C6E2|nr:hypothetical protein [Raineyella sp. W15-4]WOQ16718.1 hypothetical protein R0145_16155 [Raineyella sp. W15-4]
MARTVDPAKRARRQRALDSILFAQNDLISLVEKCGDLEAGARAEVGGHPIGDEIVARAALSRGALEGSLAAVAQARQACAMIDVTVEVPDEEERSG